EGTTLIVDIANATLSLADGSSYQQLNPIPGVASLTLEQRGSEVQLTVASDNETPPVAYFERLVDALQLDVVTVAPGATDTNIDLDSNNLRIIVTAVPLDGYRVPTASIGTRTDTAIIDIPQSIQVIPEAILEDQDTQTLGEALQNISGVQTGRVSSGSRAATPLIRGFESRNILRNGQLDPTARLGSGLPNVEQIEIIKGPASVLFGAGDLGGTINLVTERPLYDPRYQFEIGGGSFDAYRGGIDFTAPLDDQDRFAYRLNVAYDAQGSFIDFQDSDLFFVAPSLQVVNTDQTSLVFDFEYFRNRTRQSSTGLPAVSAIGLENNSYIDGLIAGGLVLSEANREAAGTLDISANLGEPDISRSETNISRVGYRLSHEFNDDWKLNHEFLASFQETPQDSFVVSTGFAQSLGQPDFSLLNRLYLNNISSRESYNFNTNIAGNFDVLGIDQTLLLGAEVSIEEARDKIIQRVQTSFDRELLAPIPRFNIFDLNYNPRRFINDLNFDRVSTDTLENRVRYGFYGQTQLNFSDNFLALLGGRLDLVHQDFQDAANNFNSDRISLSETAFSPRVGLVFKPTENVSLYASYSESFSPVIGQSFEGDVFDSERGKQWETGIKAAMFDDRLAATLAFYDLTRNNVLTQDNENQGFQRQVGEQNSRGIELDIAGEVLPGWNIIATYAYTDAKVTEDNEFEAGLRLLNSPRNSGSLFTTYQIQQGSLEGFGFGFGVYYVGDRNGDFRQPFDLPSYTRTDALLFYDKDNFRTQINFENLFDARYFQGARDQFRVQPGSPFGVSASVKWEF
ncbi:MAG: TonB-dependent siderophore receptor, partial [Phormidesmis sp.]